MSNECVGKTSYQQQLCTCQNAVNLLDRQQKIWENHLTKVAAEVASYNRWKMDHDAWKNKRGDYSKYSKAGTDEQFTVQWGWGDWDRNNACRECASGKYGWGDGRKFGGAWCEGEAYTRPKSYTYLDAGDRLGWGRQQGYHRLWWTCAKGEDGKREEITEYNRAEPLYDPQDTSNPKINWKTKGEPTPDDKLKPNGTQIVCCTQLFSDINVKDGNVDISDVNQQCSLNIKEEYNKEGVQQQQFESEMDKSRASFLEDDDDEFTRSKNIVKIGKTEIPIEILIIIGIVLLLFGFFSSFMMLRKKK